MIQQKNFKIDSRPNLEFRVGKIPATEMLALQTQINFNSLNQTKSVFDYILEHIEVKIGEAWTTVKEKGKEIYLPVDLENDLNSLQEIIFYFLDEVLRPVFKKSKE